jgi:hypothetical protein
VLCIHKRHSQRLLYGRSLCTARYNADRFSTTNRGYSIILASDPGIGEKQSDQLASNSPLALGK